MRFRFLVVVGAATVVAIVSLAPVPVAGQVPASAAKTAQTWTVPRTVDGQPDLQGVWDFRTITPMERPNELAGKQVLTDEEAAGFEEQETGRLNRDIDPKTGKLKTNADGVVPYNDFWFDRGTKLIAKRTSLIIDPPDGRKPPLTPEAAQRKAAAAEARRGVGGDVPTSGGFVEDLGPGGLRVRCILGFNAGPPITPGAYNNNIQLVQAPGYVAIVTEMIHDARIVPLDRRPHLPSHVRQWSGDSRGRWEGDTLVVDTTNFLRNTMFPDSSANLHLVERFTRVDADTLLYNVTVEDPTTWTKPWTFEVPMMKNPEPMYEYACHEGNYGLFGILSGARAQEKAAEDAAKKGSR